MMEIDLDTLREVAQILYGISEDAKEASDRLSLMIDNAELVHYGLAIGDRLLFTAEFRVLTGLDKVPGWRSYLDEVVELKSLRVDENQMCYLMDDSRGQGNIPLSLIQSMKAAAIERDQKWKEGHERLDNLRDFRVRVGERIHDGDMVYFNPEDERVYSYKAASPSFYVATARRLYEKDEQFVINPTS